MLTSIATVCLSGSTTPVGLPRVTEAAPPTGIDFVEITAADTSATSSCSVSWASPSAAATAPNR